jgi:ssDNA thymidine ADP-ribosyltransferase DarT-like protein
LAKIAPIWRKVKALYHFTDTRNLASIRQLGGLYPRAELSKMEAEVYPGGNEWSQDADDMVGMDRFVHLCLRPKHPMEHIARQEGRIVESIFLIIDPGVLSQKGVMFTPGVSNKSGMQVLEIEEGCGTIDFEVLYEYTNWNDSQIQERLQTVEKCEVLVPKLIPLSYIRNLPNG